MLTKEQNDLICRVAPGTPAGDWFRRYWIAAGFSADFKPGGQPREVRLLGEDLVMFRDPDGRMGLLELLDGARDGVHPVAAQLIRLRGKERSVQKVGHHEAEWTVVLEVA